MERKKDLIVIISTLLLGIIICGIFVFLICRGTSSKKQGDVIPGSDLTQNSSTSQDYVVDWKDKNLKTKMQNITGIYDRDILLSDVWEITELDLSCNSESILRISDITALGELKNLKVLDLSSNDIYDIKALTDLKNLEKLNLSTNHVSDLSSLKNHDKLSCLILSQNEITDVGPLAELKNLEHVELLNNPVTDYSILSFVPNLIINEESVTAQIVEGKDAHSIWIGEKEIKILEYINEEKMIAKIRLGDYVVQLVVPRSLENSNYVCDNKEEVKDGNSSARVKFTNYDKEDAVYVSYYHWDDLIEYENMKKELMDVFAGVTPYSASCGKELYIQDGFSHLVISEYDTKISYVGGKDGAFYDDDTQNIFWICMYDSNDENCADFEHDMQKMLFRKWDSNVDYLAINSDVIDYDSRMEYMYERCKNIVNNPKDFLKEYFSMEMEGSSMLYYDFYDMTGDNIPELLLTDYEKGICIVGEKNSVRIPFSDYLLRSDELDMYYSVNDNTWGTSIKQYYVTQSEDGMLQLKEGQELYCEPMLEDDEGQNERYTLDGEVISGKKYDEITTDIFHKRHQVMGLYKECSEVQSYEEYCHSGRNLTNEILISQ